MGFWQLTNDSGFTNTAQSFDSEIVSDFEYLSTIYNKLYTLELNYRYNISFKYIGTVICHAVPEPYPNEYILPSTIKLIDYVPYGLLYAITPDNYTNISEFYSNDFITTIISTGDTTSVYNNIYDNNYFTYTTIESYSYIFTPKYLAFTAKWGIGSNTILDEINLIYLNDINSPICSTLNVSNVTITGVTLNGVVNPYGLQTDAYFYLKLINEPYNEFSISGTTSSELIGTDNVGMMKNINLQSGQTYNYYTYANNSIGGYTGNTIFFYTANNPNYYIDPTYDDYYYNYFTMPSNFTYTGITIKAIMYNYHLVNNVTIEYGITESYGNYVNIPGSFTGSTSYNILVNLTGLTSTDLYYYRFKTTNDFGTSYSNVYTFRTIPLGAVFQGGHVYHFNNSGHDTGLIVSEDDIGTTTWGCSGISITGTSTSFGSGSQNTINIVESCATVGIASHLAYNLTLSGYTDWYLPSRDEIKFMNYIPTGVWYWTSSQFSPLFGWIVRNYNGRKESTYSKANNVAVRAIRKF